MLIRLGLVAALVAGVLACGSADGSTPVEAVRAADSALSAAVAALDLEGIVVHYAEDAILLPTAAPLISGKAAIRAEWIKLLAIPDLQNETTPMRVDVSASGDAWTMGTYQSRMMGESGDPIVEPGKWIAIWRRQDDGVWRIVAETYNTDIPPPDHK